MAKRVQLIQRREALDALLQRAVRPGERVMVYWWLDAYNGYRISEVSFIRDKCGNSYMATEAESAAFLYWCERFVVDVDDDLWENLIEDFLNLPISGSVEV